MCFLLIKIIFSLNRQKQRVCGSTRTDETLAYSPCKKTECPIFHSKSPTHGPVEVLPCKEFPCNISRNYDRRVGRETPINDRSKQLYSVECKPWTDRLDVSGTPC